MHKPRLSNILQEKKGTKRLGRGRATIRKMGFLKNDNFLVSFLDRVFTNEIYTLTNLSANILDAEDAGRLLD